MKNQISSSPRFLCRLTRQWSALTGGAAPRHAATCADCQHYFAACDDLDSSLRRDALGQREDVPDGMEQRIIRAVNLSKPPAPETSLWRPALLALAGVAAAIALAFLQFHKPRPSGPDQSVAELPGTATVVAHEQGLNRVQWSAALPAARELLQQDPLNDEVKSVYSDAKGAVSFLAQNFLPTASEHTSNRSQPATS